MAIRWIKCIKIKLLYCIGLCCSSLLSVCHFFSYSYRIIFRFFTFFTHNNYYYRNILFIFTLFQTNIKACLLNFNAASLVVMMPTHVNLGVQDEDIQVYRCFFLNLSFSVLNSFPSASSGKRRFLCAYLRER
jgi:hypothetical protein